MIAPILVTGSAGFIGSHVCEWLTRRDSLAHVVGLDVARAVVPVKSYRADVRDGAALRQIAATIQPAVVIHLAATADVVIPFDELGDLMTTNVNGTINVLTAMRPDRIVLASSSAVYGNASGRSAEPRWSAVKPVGAYGMTKVAAELACREWVRTTAGVAVSLRFGNVIGARCRGLIPYLVEHAVREPEGRTPARLRGKGRLVRDYVPVSYVARVIERVADMPLERGSSVIFNVGSGLAMTNRAVADVVRKVLRRRGFNLAVSFDEPVAPGEASKVVLDIGSTSRKLELETPSSDEVVEAIEQAALECLTEALKSPAPSLASA
jgi:UDP-arabinose 4-epimerase